MAYGDPVALFEQAALNAADVLDRVGPAQLGLPTPCAEWDVRALVAHMRGGPTYLLAAGGSDRDGASGDATSYRDAISACVEALRRPGVLERTCLSPLGFEWSVAEATAGTFMDQLIHTWDLAVATGQESTLDSGLVDTCIAMFLPAMPAMGRAGGLVGPEVVVPSDAPPQVRLLGAMGRKA